MACSSVKRDNKIIGDPSQYVKEGKELKDALASPGDYKYQAIIDYWETVSGSLPGDVTGSLIPRINGEGEEL